MKTKLFVASTEIEASIIKGVLESAGIEALIFPAKDNMTAVHLMNGPNVRHDILVEDSILEKATAVLKENGWISSGVSLKHKNVYRIIIIIIMVVIFVAVVEYLSFILIQKMIGHV